MIGPDGTPVLIDFGAARPPWGWGSTRARWLSVLKAD